jgi:TolA-binding protein
MKTEKTFKAPRPLPEIQMEYSQVCMRLGDMAYKLHCVNKDIETLNGQLQELNFEAVASQEAAAKEAAEAKAKDDAEAAKVAEAKPAEPIQAGETKEGNNA